MYKRQGKDNLGAVGIPALHTGGDVGIAVELAALEVVDVNVGAQLLCCSVSALHIACLLYTSRCV